MNMSEIKELAGLGFTSDQIIQLAGAGFTSAAPSLAEAPAAPEPPKAEPEVMKAEPEAPKPEPAKGVQMSEEQFNALLQKMNVDKAGVDVPPTYDLKKVLAEHYTEVMVGE